MGSQESGLCARSSGESGHRTGRIAASALDASMRRVAAPGGTRACGRGFSAHRGAGELAMTDRKMQGEGNYDAAREYDQATTAHAKDKARVKAEAEAAKK